MFYYVTDGDGVHVMCICHFYQHYLPVVFASCDILVMKYLNDTKIKIKRGKRRSVCGEDKGKGRKRDGDDELIVSK